MSFSHLLFAFKVGTEWGAGVWTGGRHSSVFVDRKTKMEILYKRLVDCKYVEERARMIPLVVRRYITTPQSVVTGWSAGFYCAFLVLY